MTDTTVDDSTEDSARGGQRPAIDVRDLRMRYGTKDVLRGITFTAAPGEVIGLLGPNGAGKTTTIETLEGFRLRSSGTVSVLGTDPSHGDEQWRSRLGIVLQSWRDHGNWRVRNLLGHLGEYYRPFGSTTRSRPVDAGELVRRVGLTEQATTRVKNLSGGQRRRLDVAIGLVGNPELLFLDEPTAGFDPQARQEFHALVQDIADNQTTIVLTTHDLDEAEKLADRILIIAGGHIITDGTAQQLARQVTQESEIRWSHNGHQHVHSTQEPVTFMRELLDQHGDDLDDLEVRRARLEDVYMTMVRQHETGQTGGATDSFGPWEVNP